MRLLKQAGIIFALCWTGEVVSALLPIAFPGSIVAMLLLFVLLCTGLIKLESIADVSSFLLGNMAFFFIPAGVSILNSYDSVRSDLPAIFAVILISTLITMAVTAGSIHLLSGWQNKRRNAE